MSWALALGICTQHSLRNCEACGFGPAPSRAPVGRLGLLEPPRPGMTPQPPGIRYGEPGSAAAGEARLPPRRGAPLDTKGKDASSRAEAAPVRAKKQRQSRRTTDPEWFPLMSRDGRPYREHGLPWAAPSRRYASRRAYTAAVSVAIKTEAMTLPHGKTRSSLLRKAQYMPLCGGHLAGFVCPSAAPDGASFDEQITGYIGGSGRLTGPVKCDARSCPSCARRTSAGEAVRLSRAMAKLPPRKGWSWKLLTFTVFRDPADPAAHTAEALRIAVEALSAGWQNCWRFLAKFPSNAAYSAIELSDGGHVHLHVLAHVPFLVRSHLAKLFAQGHNAQNGGSFRWAVEQDGQCVDMRAASPGSAREVAKYVCKGISPLDEAWLAGESSRATLHPVLLARWEMATARKQLRRAYGALRGLLAAERAIDEDEAADALGEGATLPVVCPECGGSGEGHYHQRVFDDAQIAVAALHRRGVPALRGSRWRPGSEGDDDRDPRRWAWLAVDASVHALTRSRSR